MPRFGRKTAIAVVKEIVPDMAADQDGRLQPEDKIIGIEKEDGDRDRPGREEAQRRRPPYPRANEGPRSSSIVQPDGTKEQQVYELTREKIELKEQHAKSKVIQSQGSDGKELKIGVISLPAFYGDTGPSCAAIATPSARPVDCRKILNEFKASGVDAVVVRPPRQRRRPARRSQDALRPVHRHRPGRPGQGSLRRQAS